MAIKCRRYQAPHISADDYTNHYVGVASCLRRVSHQSGGRKINGERLLSGQRLRNYPAPCYATYVTFQQSNTITNNPDRYYSQKHHLYVHKVEVSVLSIGLAVNCTNNDPGTEADITIFNKNMAFDGLALDKKPDMEQRISNEDPLVNNYPDS